PLPPLNEEGAGGSSDHDKASGGDSRQPIEGRSPTRAPRDESRGRVRSSFQQGFYLAPQCFRGRDQRQVLGKFDPEFYLFVLFPAALASEQVFGYSARFLGCQLAVAIL